MQGAQPVARSHGPPLMAEWTTSAGLVFLDLAKKIPRHLHSRTSGKNDLKTARFKVGRGSKPVAGEMTNEFRCVKSGSFGNLSNGSPPGLRILKTSFHNPMKLKPTFYYFYA